MLEQSNSRVLSQCIQIQTIVWMDYKNWVPYIQLVQLRQWDHMEDPAALELLEIQLAQCRQ